MTYRHSTADFAGISVDAFLDENDNSYLTLTSLGAGLGVSDNVTQKWLKRHNKGILGIPVRVGIRNKAATAYPASVIREFIAYRRSLGDVQAIALTDAIVEAALDRHAKETNLVTVTAAQNEQKTAAIRLALLQQIVDEHIEASKKAGLWQPNQHLPELSLEENQIKYDMVHLAELKDAVTFDLRMNKNRLSSRGQVLVDRCNSLIVKLEAQGVSC